MNDTPWYISLIVSFLPLLLFWLVFWWHGKQLRKSFTTKDGRSLADVFDKSLGR